MKAQVLAGGRGKGTFTSGLKGGVRPVFTAQEAELFASQMLGHSLITKQTGAQGKLCNAVYIVERMYAKREFYFAVLLDRQTKGPMLVASSQGGMDIETVAKENPAAIHKIPINITTGPTKKELETLAKSIGFSPKAIPAAVETMTKLYTLFIEKDATLVEINPLIQTSEGKVYCIDAKLNFDDNAEYRQQEIFALRDESQEDKREVMAAAAKINYIGLDGQIGCLGKMTNTIDFCFINYTQLMGLVWRWRPWISLNYMAANRPISWMLAVVLLRNRSLMLLTLSVPIQKSVLF